MPQTPSPEALTLEEMERVLNSDRFATIHDLVNSQALRELSHGAQPSEAPSAHDATALTSLPSRR